MTIKHVYKTHVSEKATVGLYNTLEAIAFHCDTFSVLNVIKTRVLLHVQLVDGNKTALYIIFQPRVTFTAGAHLGEVSETDANA